MKKGGLEINVKDVPTLAGCHLTTRPKSGSCGSRGICLLISLLLVLETFQYPFCFCLEEVALFVRLDGEHPYSGYMISRFNLCQMNKIEEFVVNPGFLLLVFCFSKLLVINILLLLELRLPFLHEISFVP